MGFEVKKLGPSPNSIPDSIDVLVVRVDSVSHSGDAVARKWARSNDNPIVYENGVSGIRRKLSAMVARNNLRTPPEGAPWGDAFSDEQFVEAYLEVKDKFSPSPGVENLTSGIALKNPSYFDWKEFTYKVEPNFIWHGKPVHSLIYFYLNFQQGFVPYKRDISKVYKALTGKGVSTHTMCLVAWYLHFDPPINAPRGGKRVPPPATEPGTEESVEPTSNRSPDQAPDRNLEVSVDSNTQAILEVMEDFADFKKQSQKWKSRMISQADTTEQNLSEAIKAGFDPRTNAKLAQMKKQIGDLFTAQLQNFKHEINRTLGERIAALESGIVMDREGVDEWKERFEKVKEELRGEVSDAFDSLAVAQRESEDLSSNPFAALDQVKAALKAAGFKGTLTLTIE